MCSSMLQMVLRYLMHLQTKVLQAVHDSVNEWSHEVVDVKLVIACLSLRHTFHRGCSAGKGSGSVTSSAAVICLLSKAANRASVST